MKTETVQKLHFNDMLRFINQTEPNVIATGAGNTPNGPDGDTAYHKGTFLAAMRSTKLDPQQRLDSELLLDPTRITRLIRATEKASARTRFTQKTRITPIEEPELDD